MISKQEIDAVWRHWLEKDIFFKSKWLGALAAKNPCDVWLYQEIIYDVRPDFILETGSFRGGGALFLASMLDLCKIDGDVYSIDLINYHNPEHPKLHWVTGNSIDANVVATIHEKAQGKKGLVILDSDHESTHVIEEMRAYCDLVGRGSYLIVEDTCWRQGTGGPADAVEIFLKEHEEFSVDESMGRYLITNNPNGFLKRK